MKKYEATFWRENIQIPGHGYETKRIYEAKTIASARKMARQTAEASRYGSMTLIDVQPAAEEA